MEKEKPIDPAPYEKATAITPSSSKAPTLSQPVTYMLYLTSKASRSFSSPDLPARLVQVHQQFDPSTPWRSIRVITNYLHTSTGNFLYVAGTGADQMQFRYVRVVVEMPVKGDVGLTPERKQELMAMILSAVHAYEGKKAAETEVGIVIREIRAEDELWVRREAYST